MPSSWSASLRFEKQFTGENINLWGEKLNAVLDRADTAVAGWLTKALTGSPYTLTTANADADEARNAMLKFTGTGAFLVNIPAVSKVYVVWNACTGTLTLTTGAGATVVLDPASITIVICDGSGVYQIGYGGYGLKEWIAAVAWAATSALPGQPGNAGKFLKTDGTNALWAQPASTDLSDYASRILGVQVALAVAL